MASAGPYASLHLAPDRQPLQHPTTHTFNGPFSGTTQVSRYQKGKTNLDFTEAREVSGSGISWAICKSAPRSRQITTPAPHHSVFTGRMAFLPPNQQRQSTEGTPLNKVIKYAGDTTGGRRQEKKRSDGTDSYLTLTCLWPMSSPVSSVADLSSTMTLDCRLLAATYELTSRRHNTLLSNVYT